MNTSNADRRMRFWLIGLVVAAFALYELRSVLLPFVAGMAVAYMLDPLADRLERWRMSRTVATAIITVVFFLAIVLGLFLVIPLLQSQVASFAQRLPHYLDIFRELVTTWIQRVAMHIEPQDAERLRATAGDFAGKMLAWLGSLLSGLWSGGWAIFNLASLIVLTPVVAFYFLLDWRKLVATVDSWLPRDHAEDIRTIARDIDSTLAGFARGQALVCLFLGAFYSIGLTVVGLDFGLVIGIASGLLSFIPFVGTISGFVTSVGLAFLQFPNWHGIAATAAVFVAGNLIEGNVLAPKLIGERVGLHAVWIIFALLAGGALLGFVGVLLAVPVAASVGVLARFVLKRYLASPLYAGDTRPNDRPPADQADDR